MIFLALQSYDESRSGADAEATLLVQQVETAQFLPKGAATEFTGELVFYGRSVAGIEWDAIDTGTLGKRSTIAGGDVPHAQIAAEYTLERRDLPGSMLLPTVERAVLEHHAQDVVEAVPAILLVTIKPLLHFAKRSCRHPHVSRLPRVLDLGEQIALRCSRAGAPTACSSQHPCRSNCQ